MGSGVKRLCASAAMFVAAIRLGAAPVEAASAAGGMLDLRHADGVKFENVKVETATPDARKPFVFDDCVDCIVK